MDKAKLSLMAAAFFLMLLFVNIGFGISPANNKTLIIFSVVFSILFFFKRKKRKAV